MKIHILGICGTFMGGLALLAREQGHQVGGSDQNVYPPMSTQLAEQGIVLREGYRPEHIEADTDLVVVGNALSRGNPAVEHMLSRRLPFISGPQWLGEQLLARRRVIAVAGTHGKTTTSSMIAWILEDAGMQPGFLIGGVPANFGLSARSGGGDWFVVEADEYDTAFFDKRSKFVHYRPEVAVLNNLEFDHADIFPDLAAIQTQFHHLLRTVPGNGMLVVNGDDAALEQVLSRGCWTPVATFGIGGDWQWRPVGDGIEVRGPDGAHAVGEWSLAGNHNLGNAVAACAAAVAAGVPLDTAVQAMERFNGVARRLQHLTDHGGVTVYDDFAHHPTAIAATVEGLRERHVGRRIVVALEPRSNSMRMGAHAAALGPALAHADAAVVLVRPEFNWDATPVLAPLGAGGRSADTVEGLLTDLENMIRSGDVVVFMSNGGFEAAPRRFVDQLESTS